MESNNQENCDDEWPPEVLEKVARDRAARKEIRQRDPRLFKAVSEAMFRHDPIGINFENNTDEYDLEAGTVIPRLDVCSSVNDVESVLYEEFLRWFGVENVGDRSRYSSLAQEIWQLWNDSSRA